MEQEKVIRVQCIVLLPLTSHLKCFSTVFPELFYSMHKPESEKSVNLTNAIGYANLQSVFLQIRLNAIFTFFQFSHRWAAYRTLLPTHSPKPSSNSSSNSDLLHSETTPLLIPQWGIHRTLAPVLVRLRHQTENRAAVAA